MGKCPGLYSGFSGCLQPPCHRLSEKVRRAEVRIEIRLSDIAGLPGKLGFGQRYTEGNSEEDWVRKLFEASPLRERVSFEAFKEEGYHVKPLARRLLAEAGYVLVLRER